VAGPLCFIGLIRVIVGVSVQVRLCDFAMFRLLDKFLFVVCHLLCGQLRKSELNAF